jgi:mono/diheme cytochrome c family protein
MNKHMRWVVGLMMVGLVAVIGGQIQRMAAADQPSGSYEAEKAKALANPYPNDDGPLSIDVSSYPPDIQNTYKNIFLVKCQRCHQASRPLNSQFVEPYGDKKGHAAKIAQWKTEHPEMFQDKLVWQAEGWTPSQPGIWERYVKKMMSKPGCNISVDEGRKIWQFLTYDSEKRKTGANAAKWGEHRRKLLADFKAKHAARYKELFETN